MGQRLSIEGDGGGAHHPRQTRADEVPSHLIIEDDLGHLIDQGASGDPGASAEAIQYKTIWSDCPHPGQSRADEVPSYLRIDPRVLIDEGSIGDRASTASIFKTTWSDCPCAVKKFAPENSREAIEKEWNFLIALRHPHVVRLLGLSWDRPQKRYLIVMELMSKSLRELISLRMKENGANKGIQSPPFTLPEAKDIIKKIALGMCFLHSQGIAHRDLKTANVLVRVIGGDITEVKLADFGSSLNLDSNETKEVFNDGTRFFRAPEILQLDPGKSKEMSIAALKAADVYSFAMTCYDVLTGKIPFHDELSAGELKDRVINKGHRPALPKDLGDGLTSLITACWDRDPRARPNFESICERLRFGTSLWQDDESSLFREHGTGSQVSQQSSKDTLADVAKLKPHLKLLTVIEHNDLKDPRRHGDRHNNPENPQRSEEARLKIRGYSATWLGCTFSVRRCMDVTDNRALVQELECLITLCHPHIQQLVGVSVGPYQELMVVTEHRSCSLLELIDSRMRPGRSCPFDLQEALDIISKIALGMAFLHSKNVSHRNLSPHNVFVQEHSGVFDVKIGDFALSQHVNKDLDYFETRVGITRWGPPESSIGEDQTRITYGSRTGLKVDVYSFAMTCYTTLTGKEPFQDQFLDCELGSTMYRELNRALRQGLRPFLPRNLDDRLSKLIQMCWAQNPNDRPEFGAICDELRIYCIINS